MSERHYYEFRSVDRPLDSIEMRDLRKLSASAVITSERFVESCPPDGLSGAPERLIAETFDASLWVSDTGRRSLSFRIPQSALDVETCRRYQPGSPLSLRLSGGSLVLQFAAEDAVPVAQAEDSAWMPALLPVREGLLQGDLRCLYLSWLGAVQRANVGDHQAEPPLPPGLDVLSPALKAFVEFLEIPRTLIEAAAQAEASSPRTVGSLRAAQYVLEEALEREHAARLEKRRRLREAHEAERRKQELEGLVGKEEETWDRIGELIDGKRPSDYDQAVLLLVDLRDLSAITKTQSDFRFGLDVVRDQHEGKSSFLRRLVDAGLVGDEA